MKRSITLFLVFILWFSTVQAIDFYKGDYQQGKAKAQATHKLLLLYFTANWCGPCKYMEQYVYPDAALTEYVNQHYVALKIDIDTKDGKLLYEQAHQPKGPMGVPAFIIMNNKEEILKKTVGGMKLNQLQNFLLIDQNQSVIYKLLTDSLAKKQLADNYKKPTGWDKFMFNSMVSNWKPALKIGTNLTRFSSSLPSKRAVMGYEVGIFMDRSFKNKEGKRGFWLRSRYTFQPGITLSSKAGRVSENAIERNINIHYLELGLLNSYVFKGMRYYRVFASPYAATGLWATSKVQGQKEAITLGTDLKSLDYGLKFGLSRYMGSFEPFLGYNLGLRDIKPGPEIIKNRGFYLSFALIFGK